MEQWQLLLGVLGFITVAVSGAFALGRMMPKREKESTRGSSSRTAAIHLAEQQQQQAQEQKNEAFRTEMRHGLEDLRISAIEIKTTLKQLPTWPEVRAAIKEAIEATQKEQGAKFELHLAQEHNKGRRSTDENEKV